MNIARPIFLLAIALCHGLSGNNIFTNYTNENGLPNSHVREILQDRTGYIWICTPKGISRFDGKNFKTFGKEEGITSAMSLDILCATTDDQNNIWFGTSLGGLLKFDGQKFRQFAVGDGLLHSQVMSLCFDTVARQLWIGTLKGINILKNDRIENFALNNQLPDLQVRRIVKTGDNEFWLGTFKGGLVHYNGRNLTVYNEANSFSNLPVSAIHKDKEGQIWSCTPAGIYRFSAGIFLNVTAQCGLTAQSIITTMTFGPDGELWIGTRNGLYRSDFKKSTSFGAEDGLVGDYITDVFKDKEGNVWIGTQDGLSVYKENFFRVYDKRHGIAKGIVTSVTKDNENRLWATVNGFGVLRLNQSLFENLTGYSSELKNLNAKHILIDSKKRIWVSCFRQGLYVSEDGRHFKKAFTNEPSMNNGYAIFTKAFEDSDGNLWFCAMGLGVFRFDGKQVTRISTDEITDNGINCIAEDNDKTIWMATNAALTKYKDGVFTNYHSAFLPDTICKTINFYHNDLLIGTTNGLMIIKNGRVLKNKKPVVENILLDAENIAKNEVNSTWLDGNDNLWIGTYFGLYRLDLRQYYRDKSVRLKYYGQKEGLKRTDITSTFTEINNRIYFGCGNSVVSFDPNNNQRNEIEPAVYINNIRLFLEDADWREYSDSIDKSGLPVNLSLPFNLNHLQFNFIGLSYSNPLKVRYKYKLEGFDKIWSAETDKTDITYSNLPPGDYVFKVSACNNDNLWSKQPVEFRFTIMSPFWETRWFLALVAGTLLLIVLLYIKAKTNQQKRLNKILEETITLRTDQLKNEKNKLEIANVALKSAKERAEESEKVKEQFLANMSHEIRTPMNAVIGMSNLLLGTSLEEKQKYYAAAIKSSGDNLLVIINDILDFSKINSGKIELENVPFRLCDVLNNVKTIFEFTGKEKKIELLFETAGTEVCLNGDPYRLTQILINLVGNAVKFTEKGFVKVLCDIRMEGDLAHVLISVVDSGIGIPAHMLDRVFESFSQASGDTTRKFGGTGLGLTITRQLVELFGGRIRVSSKLNEGTTFFVEMSFKRATATLTAPVSGEPQKTRLRAVLLAEDNAFNQTVAVDTLTFLFPGVVVDVAENGQEALDMLAKTAYDLVLMDIQMPVMNGIEATKMIRRPDHPRKDIPVIALTASATSDEVKRYREGGIDGYVLKPFQQEELRAVIVKVLNAASGSQPAAAVPSVLIVDDNDFNQVITADTLSSFMKQVDIEYASNGSEAIQKNKSHAFDLILMDIQMPVMDGREASREIKEHNASENRPVPIIAITANFTREEIDRCIAFGIDEVLSKPFEPADLKEAVGRHLRTGSGAG
jgi:signal transduction histidine kinase/ligand-binding sensor domain-containing protein/DNA-binding response OmpR family regulator